MKMNISKSRIKYEICLRHLLILRKKDFCNDITDLKALNNTSGSALAFDYSSEIDFAALGKSDYITYYIFDCPLDRQVSIAEALGSYRVTFTNESEFTTEQL